jgi:hypothetical protein
VRRSVEIAYDDSPEAVAPKLLEAVEPIEEIHHVVPLERAL